MGNNNSSNQNNNLQENKYPEIKFTDLNNENIIRVVYKYNINSFIIMIGKEYDDYIQINASDSIDAFNLIKTNLNIYLSLNKEIHLKSNFIYDKTVYSLEDLNILDYKILYSDIELYLSLMIKMNIV
jgi:hypothetical protein